MIIVSEMSARQKLFHGLIEKEEKAMIKVETIGEGIRVEIAGRGKDIYNELVAVFVDVAEMLARDTGEEMAAKELLIELITGALAPSAITNISAGQLKGSNGEEERMQEVIRTLFEMEEK